MSTAPLAEEAESLLSRMDELELERYRIVGEYVRFDNIVRNSLKDFRLRIVSSLESNRPGRDNFLVWGPPGSGKTYLVQQIAKSIRAEFDFKEFNLAQGSESELRSLLETVENSNKSILCFIDEVDSKPTQAWPYEALIPFMEPSRKTSHKICFVLAGSGGSNIDEMKGRIASRPKGRDLLGRILRGNEFIVPPLGVGDKLLVAAAQIAESAREKGLLIREIEKLALYYIAVNQAFSSARQLRGLAVACAERIPKGEDRIKYDYLFAYGDKENKEFWVSAQSAKVRLADQYVVVQAGQQAVIETHREYGKNRVAVLPFVSISPDPGDEYFAEGMTEELIDRLSQVKELEVIARTSVMSYKKTEKKATEIGRELSVGTLVEGSVRKAGNKIRVTAQLIDCNTERHLWSSRYDKDLEDVFAIQSDIAEQVAQSLALQLLPNERSDLGKKATNDMDAYLLFMKGRYHSHFRTRQDRERAIRFYEAAIALDPAFALAYAEISDTYHALGDSNWLPPEIAYPKMKVYATKAIEIDPQLAEGHAALAAEYMHYEWKWGDSESEFKRAIELNPSFARAYNQYGNLLSILGKFEDSLANFKRGYELNPQHWTPLGIALVTVGRYDEGIAHLEKHLQVDPSHAFGHVYLGLAYHRSGKNEQAIAELKRGVTLSNEDASAKANLALILAMSGSKEAASRLLDELIETSAKTYVSGVLLGLILYALGRHEEAFGKLERAVESRNADLTESEMPIWTWPEFEGLRRDSRWTALEQRIGL